MQITFEEVCTKAHKLQQKSVREFWTWMLTLGFLITVFSVYLIQFPEPLVRVACISGIFIMLYIGVRATRNWQRPRLDAAARPEVCLNFLRAELGRKRDEALEIRWVVCLLFPGALAFWWGGGPVGVANWLGIDWPWLLQYYESLGPLIVFAVLLALTWLGCGREAQSIEREIQTLSKQSSSMAEILSSERGGDC